MKKTKKLTMITVFMITVLFTMNSCNEKRNLKSDAYKSSIKLIDQMTTAYSMMSEISFTNKYKQELFAILNNPKINVNFNDGFEYTANLQQKQLALAALKKVYIKSDLLTDNNFTLKNSDFNVAAENACKLLKEINISEEYNKKIDKITTTLNNDKLDVNIVLQLLTELYMEMWNTDAQVWQLLVTKNYQTMTANIDSIPADVFDEDKLAKFVYEPYKGKNILVNIYKLNLIDEANKEKKNILKIIDDIAWGLDIINQLNNEFTKREPNMIFVEENIDNYNEYLFGDKKTETTKN